MELKKCVVVRKEQVDETLKTPATQGKRLLDPLKTFAQQNWFPVNILEDKEVSNEAEVHRHEADLWYCIEGEVVFVYGGEMVNPWAKKLPDGGADDREIKAKEIRNGTEATLKPGDWLYIPAGQPHLHKTDKTARLFIIKLKEPEVPLEQVPGWQA